MNTHEVKTQRLTESCHSYPASRLELEEPGLLFCLRFTLLLCGCLAVRCALWCGVETRASAADALLCSPSLVPGSKGALEEFLWLICWFGTTWLSPVLPPVTSWSPSLTRMSATVKIIKTANPVRSISASFERSAQNRSRSSYSFNAGPIKYLQIFF